MNSAHLALRVVERRVVKRRGEEGLWFPEVFRRSK
jgi:hypothetical protein